MAEAVVTDGTQPTRQHMPQITRHELHTGEGGGFVTIAFGPVLPAEGDGGLSEVDQARVVDGGARDVSAEVFKRGAAGTGGLDVTPQSLSQTARSTCQWCSLSSR